MAMKSALAVAGAGAIVALQGCGGGSTTTTAPSPPSPPPPGSSTTSGPAPSPGPASLQSTTRPHTTTLAPQPSTPLSGADAASKMNEEYKAFDPNNADGSIGTFIRITGDTKVYCHDGCHSGWADCRVSGSVYNPTQIVDSTSGTIKWSFTGTGTPGDFLGYWVDQDLIKQRLGKCAYTGDGGTDNKYNMGCGRAAACTSYSCSGGDSAHCAYAGRDPATGYTTYVNGTSYAVAGGMMGYHGDGGPDCNDPGLCGYKGPSFWKETGFVPDETFEAWKWRATVGAGNKEQWNEMVLDGELMKESLAYDPAGTIPAIVYASTYPGDGKAAAIRMAEKFQSDWNMTTRVPVIKIDLSVDVVQGGDPFVFEDTESELFV